MAIARLFEKLYEATSFPSTSTQQLSNIQRLNLTRFILRYINAMFFDPNYPDKGKTLEEAMNALPQYAQEYVQRILSMFIDLICRVNKSYRCVGDKSFTHDEIEPSECKRNFLWKSWFEFLETLRVNYCLFDFSFKRLNDTIIFPLDQIHINALKEFLIFQGVNTLKVNEYTLRSRSFAPIPFPQMSMAEWCPLQFGECSLLQQNATTMGDALTTATQAFAESSSHHVITSFFGTAMNETIGVINHTIAAMINDAMNVSHSSPSTFEPFYFNGNSNQVNDHDADETMMAPSWWTIIGGSAFVVCCAGLAAYGIKRWCQRSESQREVSDLDAATNKANEKSSDGSQSQSEQLLLGGKSSKVSTENVEASKNQQQGVEQGVDLECLDKYIININLLKNPGKEGNPKDAKVQILKKYMLGENHPSELSDSNFSPNGWNAMFSNKNKLNPEKVNKLNASGYLSFYDLV